MIKLSVHHYTILGRGEEVIYPAKSHKQYMYLFLTGISKLRVFSLLFIYEYYDAAHRSIKNASKPKILTEISIHMSSESIPTSIVDISSHRLWQSIPPLQILVSVSSKLHRL